MKHLLFSQKNYFKTRSNYVRVANFQAMTKEDNTLKAEITFYMTNKLGKPSYFQSFGKDCVREFVEKIT